MTNMFVIGKRLVPAEQVAFVEPYDPKANSQFKPTREFQARVVMIDRDSILTEQTVEDFSKEHGFRMVSEDNVATNPGVHFRVETFTPADGFTPRKPYQTRLMWRDLDGNDQSKLLVSEPEGVLARVVRGETESLSYAPPSRVRRQKRTRQRKLSEEAPR